MPSTIGLGRFAALTLATSLAATLAFAGSGPATTAPPRAPARKTVNPLYQRITALLDAERAQLVVLRGRLDQAGTSDAAIGVEREIEQVKRQTEVAIMRLQSEHARANGQSEVADRIDAALRVMLQPRQQPAGRAATPTTSTAGPSR
jgi:hypothetical protein